MRYLAIDPGDKRTGLAVGDDETGIVSPAETIVTSSEAERDRRLGAAIDTHGPDALIVGLPLNMDGSEGEAAKRARACAAAWGRRFELPVHLWDERLSSAAADESMARSGLTRGQKRARRDALAAAAILRDFLDSRKRDR